MMISGVICGLYMGTYVRYMHDYVSPKCKTFFFITVRYPTNSQKDYKHEVTMTVQRTEGP